jgi:hypothetical protein
MRGTIAKCIVLVGLGLGVLAVEGCRKQAVPIAAQPVVRSLPLKLEEPDFSGDPLPIESGNSNTASRTGMAARGRPQVQTAQVEPVQAPDTKLQAALIAAIQREQDAELLQQEQAESQRQQRELDQEVQQNLQLQQEIEAQPWIQEAPGSIPTQAIPQGPPPPAQWTPPQ